jgi:hypothetical protein
VVIEDGTLDAEEGERKDAIRALRAEKRAAVVRLREWVIDGGPGLRRNLLKKVVRFATSLDFFLSKAREF